MPGLPPHQGPAPVPIIEPPIPAEDEQVSQKKQFFILNIDIKMNDFV